MARIKKHSEDKFYTKSQVVEQILDSINLNNFDLVIEPSAGKGAFSLKLNHSNVLSLDINPEHPTITKMDWFDFKPTTTQKTLVIGNPPFGTQCDLVLKFIKKSDEIKADTIAFILPKSFKKPSLQNKVPSNYHLIKEVDLKDNSFELEGKDYSVPTVFQIWERRIELRPRIVLPTTSSHLEFVKKDQNPDYAFRRVGVNAGQIFSETTTKSHESHYFLKCNQKIKTIIENLVWEHNNTTGPKSISKGELIQKIESLL
jgi:hypothetical protein